jgi:hypothetical protein
MIETTKGSNSQMLMHRSNASAGFELGQGGGRWGVETTSQTREVFIALASLIRASRHEMG